MKITEEEYQRMIGMTPPDSKRHPRMDPLKRAAQFMPFAALPGHKDAVDEAGRLTVEKKQLDEQQKERLDLALQEISSKHKAYPWVKITYFQADQQKQGGAYVCITNRIKKIDEIKRRLILIDQTSIDLDDVSDIMIVEPIDAE